MSVARPPQLLVLIVQTVGRAGCWLRVEQRTIGAGQGCDTNALALASLAVELAVALGLAGAAPLCGLLVREQGKVRASVSIIPIPNSTGH